ncbi:DNA-protecting protein DprA [Paracoccus suum]|uniref:DNA-protecting protein DprA n=1 Tax=Paracoccus suum TaxID=2259340 RepID=A0A344PI87_9RHOB|nr:DNA-processing protein DprA [Paracoccus suum]AXC49092.1 DNA-protecting protein DprA [Paracoccus suum]
MRLFSFGTSATRTDAADDLTFLRLVRSRRVGAATFHRLLAEHGSAAAALAALPEIARAAGVSDYQTCPEGVAAAELAAGRQAGAVLLRHDDPAYPAVLRDLEDAPPVLWVKGGLDCLSRPAIAVIGARNASSLGLRMAHGMALALAHAGVSVTAGLARGIDTAAHEASCAAGTIAVLAGGISRIYPSENAALAEAIVAAGGALISEQSPLTEPAARLFPLRNRIVSGLARAVVVVEAAHRSGTLITAKCALDQGREVMAVPGHPMDARAAGCNALIRDGALLVRSAEDVLTAIGLTPVEVSAQLPMAPAPADRRTSLQRVAETLRRPAARPAAPVAIPSRADAGGPVAIEARVLSLLGRAPTEETMLLRDLGLAAGALAPALLNLEMDGRIQRAPGGMISLA